MLLFLIEFLEKVVSLDVKVCLLLRLKEGLVGGVVNASTLNRSGCEDGVQLCRIDGVVRSSGLRENRVGDDLDSLEFLGNGDPFFLLGKYFESLFDRKRFVVVRCIDHTIALAQEFRELFECFRG